MHQVPRPKLYQLICRGFEIPQPGIRVLPLHITLRVVVAFPALPAIGPKDIGPTQVPKEVVIQDVHLTPPAGLPTQ